MSGSLLEEASKFLIQYGKENNISDETINKRKNSIEKEIMINGTYVHTAHELDYGAKLAWRNSTRCIGRLFWDSLESIDARNINSAEDAVQHIRHHIEHATNKGKIRLVITIFPPLATDENPSIQFWNSQLIQYAGYKDEFGNIVGDPATIDLTKAARYLGWEGRGTPYDVLPILFQWNGESPQVVPLAKEEVMEVKIRHPDHDNWESLDLNWYAVPIISDRLLEIGGMRYPVIFNGWYMETEIAARNLVDSYRYDRLRDVADCLGLDTSSTTTFWRDRALVEMQIAVYSSFKNAGIRIVDHYTAAQQFQVFREKEEKQDREAKGDWTWLIPPVSPALTPIFHQRIANDEVFPNFIKRKRPSLFTKISGMSSSSRLGGCPFHN